MSTVGLRHVRGVGRVAVLYRAAHVEPDAVTAVENVDHRRCRPAPHLVLRDAVGRRVTVLVDLHVIVAPEAATAPLAVLEALRRQRPQCRSIVALEELPAAHAAERLHRPKVQIVEQLTDPRVQRHQREMLLASQAREDPSLRDLHADFDLRLVARLARTRRHDRRPVVPRHVAVRPLDRRLVPARHHHPGLELIRHDHLRHAVEVREGALVRSDEVSDALRRCRLSIREVRGAEHRDEESSASTTSPVFGSMYLASTPE